MSLPPTLMVGIGSPYGDDQIGWLVVDRLAAMTFDRSPTLKKAKSPVDLLDWLSGVKQLVICDACCGSGPVGFARKWHWPTDELRSLDWSGTHDFALPDVLQLAETLGHLPIDVTIWAVEGQFQDTVPSLEDAGLDGVIREAVARVASSIAHEIVE